MKNTKWRYYKKTVILKDKTTADLFEKEAVKNGFDIKNLMSCIVFEVCLPGETPIVTVHAKGAYWGRLWFHERVYGKGSAIMYKPVPKYFIEVPELGKVEVSKESYEAFHKAILLKNEEARKAKLFRPIIKPVPKYLDGLKKAVNNGYGTYSCEFMRPLKEAEEYAKKVLVNGVRPLTLHYYTEAYAKKYGLGKKSMYKFSTKYFIAYNKKDKCWKTTYSTYEVPYSTQFETREQALNCLNWLKDIGIIK